MSFNGGRGPPMMMPGMGGMGMGVGLDAGGMGPQEAVQGRSLRSYEDLDAAGVRRLRGRILITRLGRMEIVGLAMCCSSRDLNGIVQILAQTDEGAERMCVEPVTS